MKKEKELRKKKRIRKQKLIRYGSLALALLMLFGVVGGIAYGLLVEPEKGKEIKNPFVPTDKGKIYALFLDRSRMVFTKSEKEIKVGDKIITKNKEIKINNIELTYDVLPDDVSGTYNHYAADAGKVYIATPPLYLCKAKAGKVQEYCWNVLDLYGIDYLS
jgi:hypothetical protein